MSVIAPLSTYSALLTEIADWLDRPSVNDGTNTDVTLNRPNLGPVAPTLVRLCEAQMRRRLDVRQMVQTVTVALDANGGFNLPPDFGGLEALIANPLSDGRYFPQLIGVSQNVLAEQMRMNTYGYLGQPRYYTVTANRIEFSPAQSYDGDPTPLVMSMTYRRVLPPLTLMNPCNWMLTQNPDCYLYGSLAQAAPYLKDDDRLSVWAGLFGQALEDVNTEGVRQRMPAQLRMTVGMLV